MPRFCDPRGKNGPPAAAETCQKAFWAAWPAGGEVPVNGMSSTKCRAREKSPLRSRRPSRQAARRCGCCSVPRRGVRCLARGVRPANGAQPLQGASDGATAQRHSAPGTRVVDRRIRDGGHGHPGERLAGRDVVGAACCGSATRASAGRAGARSRRRDRPQRPDRGSRSRHAARHPRPLLHRLPQRAAADGRPRPRGRRGRCRRSEPSRRRLGEGHRQAADRRHAAARAAAPGGGDLRHGGEPPRSGHRPGRRGESEPGPYQHGPPAQPHRVPQRDPATCWPSTST